jgi:DNA-binding transcriptional regulator YdaS (Cro superfamily)
MHFKLKPAHTATITAIAFTALVGLTGPAIAQSAAPGTPAPAVPSQSVEKTDEGTVKTFAVALAAVQDVQIEYIEKIKATNEPTVVAQLQNEAHSKMVKVVETKGLSVNQYNGLAQQMQADPSFRQRVERAMAK